MKSGIYLITCTVNKSRYVGSSKNIPARWNDHKKRLRLNTHVNRYMQRSWDKYGKETFKLSVLEDVENEDDLIAREQHYIDTLNPEFNLCRYAGRPTTEGLERTDEWLENMSIGIKKYWSELSDEEKAARVAKTTRPHTEESKKLISQKVRKAYKEGRIPLKRKPRTDEEKAKILKGMEENLRKRRMVATQRKLEWEAGREDREMARRQKLSIANTGKVHSEKTRAKLSEIATVQMNDPKIQEKHRQAVIEAMQRPEVKDAMANRPTPKPTKETIEKRAAAHRGRKNSPETIELMKQKRREWWANKKAQENII